MTFSPTPHPSLSPEDAPPVDPRVRRRDRAGVIVAWIAITLAVAAIATEVQRATLVREAARRQARLTGVPVNADDPQLRLTAKYAVGVARVMRMMGMPPPPNLSADVSQSAKSPADRLVLVPVVAEIDGRQAALSALEQLSPRLAQTTATRPAGMPPTTEPAGKQPVAALPAAPLHPDDARIAAHLHDLYQQGPAAVSTREQAAIVERLGWTGRLAMTFDNAAHPDRQALLNDAIRLAVALLLFGLAAVGGVVAGLVLLIFAIVLIGQGSIRMRYQEHSPSGEDNAVPQTQPAAITGLRPGELPAPWAAYGGPLGALTGRPPATHPAGLPALPPVQGFTPNYAVRGLPTASRYRVGPLLGINGRSTPFLESFAIYLAGQVGVSLLIRGLMDDPGIGWNFLALAPVVLALFWPRLRGIRGSEFRRGFGWTAPRGLFRELGSGVVGYIAGLPVFIVGIVIMLILVKLTDASPTHPIQQATGGGPWQILLLFLLASVWAPVVEETFFRGALFHHLRTRWGWVFSALLSSLIFALVHPQGWTLVPGLAALAIVFCAIREWRGSTFGAMAAHALHNGTLVTMLVLAAG